jgi:hypothetical protein
MATERVVRMADFMPARLQLVCSKCGASGEMQCNCGVSFVREANLTRKGDQVAEALRDPANARKSNVRLAEELGVDEGTVRKARQPTSENSEVEKRVGRDGKARKAPRERSRPVEDRARAVMRERVETGQPINARKVSAEQGFSHWAGEQAAAAERAAKEARDNLLDELHVDPGTLSTTAAQKLEVAKRLMERELKVELAARMKQIDEEVRQRVLTEGKAYRDRLEEMEESARVTTKFYRDMIGNHKAIFTAGQFMTILKCLHPDNSASPEIRAEAFSLFNAKKLQLTKEQ